MCLPPLAKVGYPDDHLSAFSAALGHHGYSWGILSPTTPFGITTVIPMTQGFPNPVRDLDLGIVFVTTPSLAPPHWPLKRILRPDA